MRKFLSILGSLGLTTIASATVIACSARVNSINVQVGSEDFADGVRVNGDTHNTYSLTQLIDATMGVISPATMSFAQLFAPSQLSPATVNNDIFNLLTHSGRKIVNPNNNQRQLQTTRDTFAGREAFEFDRTKSEATRYLRPSVDGAILNWESQEDYYQLFTSTSINSIEGLYKLANFTGDIGSGLTASKAMADNLFADGVGRDFAELFLNVRPNPFREAAFTNIKYNASSTVRDIFSYYETQASLFESTQQSSVGGNLTTTASGDFKTVNEVSDEDREAEANSRIQDRTKTDPAGRLILAGNATPTPASTLRVVDKAVRDQQPMVQLTDSSTVYLFNNQEDAEAAPDYRLIANQYLYQPVNDLTMEYTFQTDARTPSDRNQGTTYTLNFNLTNLSAVWTPLLFAKPGTNADDEQRPVNVVWAFVGYKFSRGTSVTGFQDGELTEEQTALLQFELTHRFQDFQLSGLTIA